MPDLHPPEGWKLGTLSNVTHSIDAGVSVNSEDRPRENGELGILKTSSVLTGIFRPNEHKAVIPSEIGRVKEPIRSGCIIVSRMNTPQLVGANAYVPETVPYLFLPDRLWQLQPSNKVNGRWLACVLGSERFRSCMKAVATGTSNSMKNISQLAFLSLPIQIPPKIEQDRIVDVLFTWDEAIEKTEKLIAAKGQVALGLAQRLLPAIHDDRWPVVSFADVFTRVARTNGNSQSVEILSVTMDGIVKQSDYFNKTVASDDRSKYLRIERGDFVMSGLNFWMGSVDVLTKFEAGIISPAYKVFMISPEIASISYMKHFARGQTMLRILRGASVQGASIVRRNLDLDSLLGSKFSLPPLDRQLEIANTLDLAWREVELHRQQLDALQKQKRGLMRKLLTGEWRVPLRENITDHVAERAVAEGA